MKKEIKIITEWERVMTGKSVKEFVFENRDWLLGETGLNAWQWCVDLQGNVILERLIHPKI